MTTDHELLRVITDMRKRAEANDKIYLFELEDFADRLQSLLGGGWQPIDTLPNTGEVVLFYLTGKRPCMNRADDFHRGWAHWLEGATHWRYLPQPPEQTLKPTGGL